MTVRRVKTTMSKVQKAVSPYVQKHAFGRDTVPFSEEKILEFTGILKKKEKKKKDDLDWIDRIEEYEAFMDD